MKTPYLLTYFLLQLDQPRPECPCLIQINVLPHRCECPKQFQLFFRISREREEFFEQVDSLLVLVVFLVGFCQSNRQLSLRWRSFRVVFGIQDGPP